MYAIEHYYFSLTILLLLQEHVDCSHKYDAVLVQILNPNDEQYRSLFSPIENAKYQSEIKVVGDRAITGKYTVIARSGHHEATSSFDFNKDKFGDKKIIIPSEFESTGGINYFEPRFTKILYGQTVTWINNDTHVYIS
ncbi:MAG TPA: hypothetical protein VFS97_07620 [Nitrososphaeraceae archaeon]|nr:hypothetical protein [Nitrososphaeraceae archaeon]